MPFDGHARPFDQAFTKRVHGTVSPRLRAFNLIDRCLVHAYNQSMMSLHPIILAGDSGTRLWPTSRESIPIPSLGVAGEYSMLQETMLRLNDMENVSPPSIICNEEHRYLVAEHSRQIGILPASIILEPEGRNTAPALALAALSLRDQATLPGALDPVMLVLPADHVIRDVRNFQAAVLKGVDLAATGGLVTFGVVPTAPKTGYGYIRKGSAFDSGLAVTHSRDQLSNEDELRNAATFWLDSFVEKPDEATAARMLESGAYLWNSGIFMMRASVWLEQLEIYRPDIAQACRIAYDNGSRDGDFYRPNSDDFLACPSDTIDYAVMEKVAGGHDASGSSSSYGATAASSPPSCVVIPLDAGWSDVGAWSAFWEEYPQDEHGNVIQGEVYVDATHNSLLIGRDRLVAAVGLDDVIIVETADAVLVAHKDRVDDVKSLIAMLTDDHENHRTVQRPWGSYETIDFGQRSQVNRPT